MLGKTELMIIDLLQDYITTKPFCGLLIVAVCKQTIVF